jgi:hypothetical protein
MDHVDPKIDRLLRSAAQGREDDVSAEAPFGFDTRVVALWRAAKPGSNGLGRLLRRVALAAASVIIIATAAAFFEVQQDRDDDDVYANEFAIADSAIQNEFLQ